MLATAAERENMRLVSSTPPYRFYHGLSLLRPRRGAVFVAHLDAREAIDESVQAELREIRRSAPWAHITIHVPEASVTAGALLLQLTQACALTARAQPSRASLVNLLRPVNLEHQVLRWIQDRKPALRPTVLQALERAIYGSSATEATDAARQRHRRAGLPSPSQTTRLLRALPPLIRLQSSSLSVNRAAIEAGFADGSALSESCQRLFGGRPSWLRSVVGWRWLIWRWWQCNAMWGRSIPKRREQVGNGRYLDPDTNDRPGQTRAIGVRLEHRRSDPPIGD